MKSLIFVFLFSLFADAQDVALRSILPKQQIETIKVYNPEYKREMTYQGFRLKEVLRTAGFKSEQQAYDIVFTCADGFTPSISYAEALRFNLFIAAGEKKIGQFTPLPHGSNTINPAPFYVVSTDSATHSKFPWPFQVVSFEVIELKKKFEKIFPKRARDGSAAMRGFDLFRHRCLSCHAINQQGGDVGPELNLPRNITEYRDETVLRQFIKNPSSFRVNSKMPALHLNDEELDSIVAYLKHMKDVKLK